jgi:hypothetical protein
LPKDLEECSFHVLFENRALVSKKGKGFLQISVLESRQQWYEITSKHLMAIIYVTGAVFMFLLMSELVSGLFLFTFSKNTNSLLDTVFHSLSAASI